VATAHTLQLFPPGKKQAEDLSAEERIMSLEKDGNFITVW